MKQTNLFDNDLIDGIDATFAEAKFEPFHSWYSYLEGYSASFVENLRKKYMPAAQTILEPFAGTGTTPFTLARIGIRCGYSEVNPVMRWVISSKLAVAALATEDRRRLAARLEATADLLDRKLSAVEPDRTLVQSYSDCFGNSKFFSETAFEQLLRLRALADQLDQDDPLLSRLLVLAVMAQIVQCSFLKRAGDVRYKTESELKKGIPILPTSVGRHLRRLAADTSHAPTLASPPWLVTPNAKNLRAIPSSEADGVITSPPYLNGTNYIRNTKLELWFSRLMKTAADLRELRDQVVTSGINDVARVSELDDALPRGVADVVRTIRRDAYDQRIPAMVAMYFRDMADIIDGLALHCRPGATLCIDIGDSRYGGVHVPTHDLLVEVAEAKGLKLLDRLPLRQRLSKDKSPLTQEVLVFERPKQAKVLSIARSVGWQRRWDWFKHEWPHQQSPYTARNWGHPLHSACSYLGKMKPSLAHFLVHCFSEPGQRVLDPFSGAGTIPFEAALGGREAFALDISLLAVAVTSAKIAPPPKGSVLRLVSRFEEYVRTKKATSDERDAASLIRFNGPLHEYFNRKTFDEVLVARRFFQETANGSAEWFFVLACMLHILHGNRPYAVSRRSHPVTPFAPTGPAEYRSVVDRLRAKVDRSLSAELPPDFRTGTVLQADLLRPWPESVKNIDAIITSPPFFDSTRFYMANWMRFWFAGWERDAFEKEPARYVESLQKQSLSVYEGLFRSFRKSLSERGVAVLHLGKSRKCDMARGLAELAPAAGLRVEEVVNEDVTHCESHGVRDKGTVTAHQYLVLTPA